MVQNWSRESVFESYTIGERAIRMGREQFSAPEESTRERQRKLVVQSQIVLFGAFAGAFLESILSEIDPVAKVLVLVILILLALGTNRYWERIHHVWN